MAAEYLGTGNDDGVILGRSTTDKIGFFNKTPAVTQATTLSAAITAGATLAGLAPAFAELYAALKAYGLLNS